MSMSMSILSYLLDGHVEVDDRGAAYHVLQVLHCVGAEVYVYVYVYVLVYVYV
jgi:hypothetical protein